MASADENSVQLQSNPAFLTPPAPVVKSWSFHCIPCSNRLGSLVSRDELIKFAEQALAPHPICKLNLAESLPGLHGTIQVMRSQVNIILD